MSKYILTKESLLELDRNIREFDLKSLKFLSRALIPDGILEKIDTSYRLFEVLLGAMGLHLPCDGLLVAQFLYLIRRKDLVKMLQFDCAEVQSSMRSMPFFCSFRVIVLFEICNNMVAEDVSALKFLLASELPKSQLQNIKDSEDVINILESIFLDEESLKIQLENWFLKLNKHDLVKILRNPLALIGQPKKVKVPVSSSPVNDIHAIAETFPSATSEHYLNSLYINNNSCMMSATTIENSSSENQTSESSHSVISDHYPMTHSPSGICLIINNEYFEESEKSNLKSRTGSSVDADSLKDLFENSLDFKVIIKKNLTGECMIKEFEKWGMHDHSNYDCFIAFILSHGDMGSVYGIDGSELFIKSILSPFKRKKCLSLSCKPKIFFIQACQGTSIANEDLESDTNSKNDYTFLEEVDFLVSLSTLPGFLSVRSRKSGTWYIGSLVDVIKKYYSRNDLIKMLTLVTKNVNEKTGKLDGSTLKQVPLPMSTLTQLFYLTKR